MKLPQWLRWRSNEDLDEELQAHLEAEVQLNLDRGMSPQEARYAARRVVGNPTQIKEQAREADPLFRLELIGKDLHYAWRGLRRNPGFTFAAVLSLALGIGANTAIFSFVDAIMLRPIPAPRAQEIVRVMGNTPKEQFEQNSYREFTAYRDQSHTLTGVAAETFAPFSIRANEQSVATYGHIVSGNFFTVFEINPQLGRTFAPQDDSSAAETVAVVLSHRIWNTAFKADPKLIGAAVRLNGQAATVIGILPEEFTGTDTTNRPQVYTTLATAARLFPETTDLLTNPQRRSLNLWGRLKPGIAVESAQADLATISRALEQTYPESNRERGISVMPELTSRFARDPSNTVFVVLLLGMVGFILLVACANVANLLLGRATARGREFAIRMSVGASRGRLIGQLLTESFLLAALGTGAGLVMASWAASALAAIPIASDIPFEFALRIDNRVLAYTALAMVGSVGLFGLWPALAATRAPRIESVWGKRRYWGRNTLIVAQSALVSMLLIAAGLFAQAFVRASQASPGFRVDNLLMATFDPSLSGYSTAKTQSFYGELQRRVAGLPGVRSLGLGSHVPLVPFTRNQSVTRGGLDAKDVNNQKVVLYSLVTPGFFTAINAELLGGRAIDGHDTTAAPVVAVVNETMARELWPGGDAIGQQLQLLDFKKTAQVVGITRDAKYDDILEGPTPYLYLSFGQHSESRMTLIVHTGGDAAALAPILRGEVASFAPDLAMTDVQTMRTVFVQMGLLLPRLIAQLVSLMALIGLVIGLTGLYAVIAFIVNQRTREFGIRMALGATSKSILQSVLFSGFRVTAVGLALGLAGALAINGYFAPLLSKIDPRDPLTFIGVSILLLIVALAACWIPARRASLVDPAVTLRQE